MGESSSTEIQEANALIKNEYQGTSLVIDMAEGVQRPCCIYNVPDPLRNLKKEDYCPQVISIGPFHHGDKKLQKMEKYKGKYLKAFMERAEINMEDLKSAVEDWEESVRQCYAQTFPLISSDAFVEMILMDASFIIEFFLRSKLPQWTIDDMEVLKPELAARMQLDLILLENQLPFFIINKLFNLAGASRLGSTSFVELTFEYFHSYNKQEMDADSKFEILHFLDLLRNFYLPPRPCLPKRKPKTVELECKYGATQLDGVGLKFEADLSSNCLLDLRLKLGYKKAVLKIPRFTFGDDMELYVRNLLALEQCHYPNKEYVSDYFILLDFLINSEKDVDLLREKGILVTRVNNKHATNFINNLCTCIISSTMSSEYYDICIKLKNFYEDPSNGWWVSLRQDYCGSPWKAASTIAAILLLILTLIQTVCSIISVLPHR